MLYHIHIMPLCQQLFVEFFSFYNTFLLHKYTSICQVSCIFLHQSSQSQHLNRLTEYPRQQQSPEVLFLNHQSFHTYISSFNSHGRPKQASCSTGPEACAAIHILRTAKTRCSAPKSLQVSHMHIARLSPCDPVSQREL